MLKTLARHAGAHGEVLVGSIDGPVRFGFTERTGGVSRAPYASLNLGSHVGDDPAAVEENRRRTLDLVGAQADAARLLVPNQVHGDRIAVVSDASDSAFVAVRAQIAEGADAIVCTVPGVPVLLCFADCVPVILTCASGFAVVHSGWRGTYARIAGKTARALSEATGVPTSQVSAYIGPHILGDEYEVSPDLMHTFSLQFDNILSDGSRMLDLSRAICQSLTEVGVSPCEIQDTRLSTMRLADRFYSYRREHGTCGRHGAIAYLAREPRDSSAC